MAVKYEMCPESVQDVCTKVMEKDHGDLVCVHVRVCCLFASSKGKDGIVKAAVKLHGRSCYATCRIVPERDQALGMPDAVILIDENLWGMRIPDPKQRRALLDHELTHLLVKRDEDGVVYNECGRPKLEMRQHDWELTGFAEVMKRHGDNSMELLGSSLFSGTPNGQLFFDYMLKQSKKLTLVPKTVPFEKSLEKGGTVEISTGGVDVLKIEKGADGVVHASVPGDEDLIAQAIEVIRSTKRASTSGLQRRLRVGYNRAANLMDQLEARGVIGPAKEKGARDVLIDLDAVGSEAVA